MKSYMRCVVVFVLPMIGFAGHESLGSVKAVAPRQVVSLDGQWQIEQGGMESPPRAFSHTVAVPGLVDMATPAFAEVGRKSPLRAAFWYHRTFTLDGPVPAVAILMIHKAQYGAKVYLNGRAVGEHLPCFTPALVDVKPYLKGDGQANELVIRVGAGRESLPADIPDGHDFEKCSYIPGIYDSVELILTAAPYIVNVQMVPDISGKAVRVVAEIQAGDEPCEFSPTVEVGEARSGKTVATAAARPMRLAAGETAKLDLTIPIPGCRLWSPEDPFLYEARIHTGGDAVKVRFGMRTFRADPATGRAVLNGRPYFLRGTNVTIQRFFEDAHRGDLPWRPDWVRRFHEKCKTMHWNAMRYCIGFPPDFWYDVADEVGFLIQDEFPIWLGDINAQKAHGLNPKKPTAEELTAEYAEWMRQRWNHPCVVIWDAANETTMAETGRAIAAVRGLDLSNRPWENGWSEPQSRTDVCESHPYLMAPRPPGHKPFSLGELETTSPTPPLTGQQKSLAVPIIINEYDWLWLNRDGSATYSTAEVYNRLLGPKATAQQRRLLRARYMAALTEFWRCHRKVAGVMYFCSLGYSRPGDKPPPESGVTCDDFIDIEKPLFEPLFEEHMREAFHPVGLMLDFWAEEVAAGGKRPLRVFVVNDFDAPWKGDVRVRIVQGEREWAIGSQTCEIAALGREILTFDAAFPDRPGQYTLVAELSDATGKPVRSLRDFRVK